MKINEVVMLARAIAAQHNVRVEFASTAAATRWENGRAIITLPCLAEQDAVLCRGYLDHEVGHVRFTDHTLAPLSSAEHTAWNIFEDVWIEERMGRIFPGAAVNLKALEERIFDDKHFAAINEDPPYFSYLLYKRRGLKGADELAARLPDHLRGLLVAAASVPTASTADNVQAARDYVALLPLGASANCPGSSLDIGELAALGQQRGKGADMLVDTQAMNISPYELGNPIPVNQMLVNRLDRALAHWLQSMCYKPAQVGRSGQRLSMRHLHRVSVGDDRVFRTPARRLDKSIEIGILLDYSGSMYPTLSDMEHAAAAIYGMLARVPKARTFVYGFEGYNVIRTDTGNVLRHMECGTTTPTATAMLRILSEFTLRLDQRHVLLVVTDGDPDNIRNVLEMNAVYDSLGIERYGISIRCGEMLARMFDHWVDVQDVATELAPAMYGMLRKAMA